MKRREMAKSKTTGKTVARKAASKKTSTKAVAKAPVKKKTAKKDSGVKAGNKYVCGECGLAVTIDTESGIAEILHLICCEEPMKEKR
jgi:hypothetical protein